MASLIFAYDVELDKKGNWIKEGTVVKVSDNEFYLKRFQDSTPVIITEAYDCNSEKIQVTPSVEWLMNYSLVELS